MKRVPISEIRELASSANEEQLRALERSLAGDSRKGVASLLEAARRRIAAQKAEDARLQAMYDFQAQLALEAGASVVVGLDEAGRGPLAGPLAVGAVVLPESPVIVGLNDSKQVKEDARARIAEEVKKVALAWSVEYVEACEIDKIGIMASLRGAFARAVASVEAQGCRVDAVLLDGNPMNFDPRETNVVRGDAKCASIAAASILAKVARDSLMVKLDVEYPGYGLASNKGYGTDAHRKAIHSLGLSAIHRKSFCGEFLQGTLF